MSERHVSTNLLSYNNIYFLLCIYSVYTYWSINKRVLVNVAFMTTAMPGKAEEGSQRNQLLEMMSCNI